MCIFVLEINFKIVRRRFGYFLNSFVFLFYFIVFKLDLFIFLLVEFFKDILIKEKF